MALQGNLDDFSLPEILQLISVQQKSGVLKLTAGDDVAVVFFEAGKIVSTRDRRRNARDPLKPYLVRTGYLTEAQLKQIETIEAESRRELTDVLLSGNYMTSEGLTQALEHQIQDTLHQLLTWKSGSYHFSGDSRTVPKFAVNVRLNTEGLLMESMRRIDEIVRYRETLSSPAMMLRPKPLAMPPKEMSSQERRILPLVDGLRPLRDLVAQSKLVEFEAFEALHHLLDLGVIEVSLGAAPAKVTPIAATPPPVPARRTANSFLAVAVAIVSMAAAFAIAFFVTPALLSRAARAAAPAVVAVPPEIALVDEAARVSLALETYRRVRGEYPPDLETLGVEGYLPAAMARAAARLYQYQSDGATYSRVLR
ncbi:MAG TPA: DUF4388 domain-containing protein [Candidatus Dormibacteraeota bacterium]|nr:DUF4388 domain-containing protein [Candidatus Dormibacteraeota bacterium]